MGDTTTNTTDNGQQNATGSTTGGNAAGGTDQGAGGQQTTDQSKGGATYTPPASQAELDRIVQERVERAKKPYADYDQLKADADKWRQAEQEKLPAEQRSAQQIEDLRRENETLRSAQLRSDTARAKGVPPELITGTTKEELEASADALLAFRGPQPGGPVVNNEGTGTAGAAKQSTDWLGDRIRES